MAEPRYGRYKSDGTCRYYLKILPDRLLYFPVHIFFLSIIKYSGGDKD